MEWDWTRRIFDHVEVSASDYPASVRFYETVLRALGVPRVAETGEWTGFANLNVVDRRPATTDLHLCFIAHSRDEVDRFHAAGVDAGFRSNGAPGYRDYGPGFTPPSSSTPTGTTSKPCTGTSGTSGTASLERSHKPAVPPV